MSIQDKVVVITGASSGIGAATAVMLAKHGAKVMLGARRTERLEALVRNIQHLGGKGAYYSVDVTRLDQVQGLVQAAMDEFGRVDAIFNNAGIDEWNAMIDVNLKGVLHGIVAVMPIFKAQKSGHIITTSSVAGLKHYVGSGVYGATKFAVRNAMEVVRMESAQEGTNIRTTTLFPAAIDTELIHHIGEAATADRMKTFYKAHSISPDAVAACVRFALEQPEDVDISEMTIYPTSQA